MARKTDSIRLWQHDNGTWYVLWSGGTEIRAGENRLGSKRVSTGTKDRKLAEQFRAQFIAGLSNPAPPDEPTIGYLLDRYRNEHGVNTRSLQTIDYHLKSLRPFFGDLRSDHVSNNLLKEYTIKRRVSAGTILRELGTLKAALHYAEGNRWIAKQPQFIMPVRQPPPRDLWLTREQVATLINAAKSHHMKLFIQLAVATAARSGAILDLTWSQVDLKKRLIDFGRGWGNKRRATVPMNDSLYAGLSTAHELHRTDHVIEYHGKTVVSIKSGFKHLCQDCDIKASPHVLRHTAATWLVSDGVPLAEVARLLGDSERTVEKVYSKHAPDYSQRAVNALNVG
jgi:integrase